MSIYQEYVAEVEDRKTQGLHPKPIDSGELVAEIITQIKDADHEHRADSLHYLIYNTLPGTTSAAGEKARFLEEIILGKSEVEEISPTFAFELLSHMKGGPSIEVLLNLALGEGCRDCRTGGCRVEDTGISLRCGYRALGDGVP